MRIISLLLTAFWLTFPPSGTFVDTLGIAPPPRRGKGGQVLSHISEALTFPPEHTQLASTRQAEEQPSPPKRFPSSHSSPSCGVYFSVLWYFLCLIFIQTSFSLSNLLLCLPRHRAIREWVSQHHFWPINECSHLFADAHFQCSSIYRRRGELSSIHGCKCLFWAGCFQPPSPHRRTIPDPSRGPVSEAVLL